VSRFFAPLHGTAQSRCVVPAKTWLVIPALALACIGLGILAGQPVHAAVALGALAAALAAAVRAFAGPSLAAAVAATAAALVGVLAVLELPAADVMRAAIAGAAAMFAIAELARPLPPGASPWPALGASLVAGVLDPSYVVLLPVAGVRLITGPWSRPRWSLAVPAAGALVVALAVLAAVLRDGALAELWRLWADRASPPIGPLAVLAASGDVLGPITTFVACAGLAGCALRGRIAGSAALGALGGALAVDLVAGSPGAATLIVAALGAGAGIARFAGLIRWPAGQTCAGAAVGFMLVVAPAWTLALR
jgi:hypothetical protein